MRSIRAGQLDQLEIPKAPLDILAQQIVAMCAAEDWREEELFQVVRRAFPYRNQILDMTFGVVIFSILVQGLTMKPFLRLLRIADSHG